MSGYIIHANALPHQRRLAEALREGLHGAVVTSDPLAEGETHVVLGPHFALEPWRYRKTLYIDRAYWGDPDCVSIHWLYNGEKWRTRLDDYRPCPELQPMRPWGQVIYLCDYGKGPEGKYDAVRYHPAEKDCGPLDFTGYGVAVGKRTTALVDAAVAGLTVLTDDQHSPVWEISGAPWKRDAWVQHLAWHNWSHDEIARGVFLDAISDGYPS